MAIETKTFGDVQTVTSVGKQHFVPVTTADGNLAKIGLENFQDSLNFSGIQVLVLNLAPQFTLEQTSDPAFSVTNKDGAVWQQYRNQMGGYMLLVKNGSVYAAKLNANDWNQFADGTDATSMAAVCETMVHLPDCYYKGDGKTLTFAGATKMDGLHKFASPNWVGAYEMYVDSAGAGHSRPDVAPGHSKTMSAFWSCAQKLGTQWGLANYGFHCLINALYQVGYGNLNSQATIGTGGTTSWDTWRDVLMGYGRTIGDGSGTAATSLDGQNCVKLFGFEDLWAKLWEFRPGIRFYYDSTNAKRYAVVYDGNIVSNTTAGRTFEIPVLNGNGSYVKSMTLGEYWDMMLTAVGGGESIYYGDGYWDATGGELLYVGGHANGGSLCGVSCASSSSGFSYSGTGLGARLAFYGQPTIVNGSELVALAGAS